jgi:hypothetical protein
MLEERSSSLWFLSLPLLPGAKGARELVLKEMGPMMVVSGSGDKMCMDTFEWRFLLDKENEVGLGVKKRVWLTGLGRWGR